MTAEPDDRARARTPAGLPTPASVHEDEDWADAMAREVLEYGAQTRPRLANLLRQAIRWDRTGSHPVSDQERRAHENGAPSKSSDNCPHCGKSMWRGDAEGCTCTFPAVTFSGTLEGFLQMTIATDKRGYFEVVAPVRFESVIANRRALFHLEKMFRFLAEHAKERLDGWDEVP